MGREREYTILDTGEKVTYKPEYMTELQPTLLVEKTHAQIVLRGKIDTYLAEILQVQYTIENFFDDETIGSDLQSILDFVRLLQKAEVLDEPVAEVSILGLTSDEIRDQSHHPTKYYQTDHLFQLSVESGEFAIHLNYLRTKARELELAALEAYKVKEGSLTRPDLAEAYNRLSSALYIMMLRAVSGVYREAGGSES